MFMSMAKTDHFPSAEQQTLFLQNMLRNTAMVTMAAPALSGTVSSATAHGYLPQYRGSAAASLAPAMLLNPASASASDSEHLIAKRDGRKEYNDSVAPFVAARFLPENYALNRDEITRSETMGAEAYMRYITRKADDDPKIVNQGWNSNTTGTGPIMGSNW